MVHAKIFAQLLLLAIVLGPAGLYATSPLGKRLIDAAESGDIAMISALLAEGASVNASSPIGKTPLMFAAQDGHIEAARLLLSKGAYTHAKTEDGYYTKK